MGAHIVTSSTFEHFVYISLLVSDSTAFLYSSQFLLEYTPLVDKFLSSMLMLYLFKDAKFPAKISSFLELQ